MSNSNERSEWSPDVDYYIAYRERFTADWRDAAAYHVVDAPRADFTDLAEATRAADAVRVLGHDVIVVEFVRGEEPTIVYG